MKYNKNKEGEKGKIEEEEEEERYSFFNAITVIPGRVKKKKKKPENNAEKKGLNFTPVSLCSGWSRWRTTVTSAPASSSSW